MRINKVDEMNENKLLKKIRIELKIKEKDWESRNDGIEVKLKEKEKEIKNIEGIIIGKIEKGEEIELSKREIDKERGMRFVKEKIKKSRMKEEKLKKKFSWNLRERKNNLRVKEKIKKVEGIGENEKIEESDRNNERVKKRGLDKKIESILVEERMIEENDKRNRLGKVLIGDKINEGVKIVIEMVKRKNGLEINGSKKSKIEIEIGRVEEMKRK